MGKLILYGADLSCPVRACKLILAQLGLPYEYKVVDLLAAEHMSAEFGKINPQHTVPVLEDEGAYIWDSQAICTYLIDKYAKDDQLYPKDLLQRAKVNQRLFFNTSIVYMAVRNITLVYFRDKVTVVSKEKVLNIIEAYNLLEIFLADNPYIVGDQMTVADLCCVSNIVTAAGIVPIDVTKYPMVVEWIARLEKLPFYEEANGKGARAYNEFLKKVLTEVQL